MTHIDASRMDYRQLNAAIRRCSGDISVTGCLGQRFIGAGLGQDRLTITGTPGNALGAYLDGACIEVNGDAQDAVGQAVLLAWQSLDRLRDPEALRAWLVKISVNCARQLNRRSRREVYLEDLPPQAAAREDPRPELWDAVLSLPRDQRAAVVLYYYEDLPVADIASLLRVPAGTVKSRLSRARDKLRLALSDPQVTRKEE